MRLYVSPSRALPYAYVRASLQEAGVNAFRRYDLKAIYIHSDSGQGSLMFLRLGTLRKALFGASPSRISNEYPSPKRGEQQGLVRHMETAAQVFMHGMCQTLEDPTLWNARFIRDRTAHPWRGVCVEGLAAGIAGAELLTPFSKRKRALEFAEDRSGNQRVLAYVGIGVGCAFFHRHPKTYWPKMHADSRDWVLDGYAFMKGYFSRKKYVDRQVIPYGLARTDLMMFDQGLGRVIWIMSGGDVERTVKTFREFPADRQRALWGGLGVVTSYVGICDEAGYQELTRRSGDHRGAFARGIAFSCYQCVADENVCPHTEIAARLLWNKPVQDVAEMYPRLLQEAATRQGIHSRVAYAYRQLECDAVHQSLESNEAV